MATDYDPAQQYAERRGITFRERVAEIVRKVVPEKVRTMFSGLRLPADGRQRPEPNAPNREPVGADTIRREADPQDRKVAIHPDAELRRAKARALVRHARAFNAIMLSADADDQIQPSPEMQRELRDARKAFEDIRPHGWRDAEAAYVKDPSLVSEAADGRTLTHVSRAVMIETELRFERDDLSQRADRFVSDWRKLERASEQRFAAGDYSGHRAPRARKWTIWR